MQTDKRMELIVELKALRISHGYSQCTFANMCGVSQKTISAIETGTRKPSHDLAKKIAKIFDLSINQIWEMFYEKQLKEA